MNDDPARRLHVVTGGFGSGKTGLIATLAACGIRHMPEAGRSIIRDRIDIGGSCRLRRADAGVGDAIAPRGGGRGRSRRRRSRHAPT